VDVNRILKILLAVGMMEDFVSWNYTKKWHFAVRSAYFVEWDHQHGRKLIRTNVMGTSDINPVWSQVWKLKVSAKIKIFAWRLLHGTIPCNSVLANRHIIDSSIYPVCQIHCEDTMHLFFGCPRVREIWENLGILAIIDEACTTDRVG
jgi:hypothetical protein